MVIRTINTHLILKQRKHLDSSRDLGVFFVLLTIDVNTEIADERRLPDLVFVTAREGRFRFLREF